MSTQKIVVLATWIVSALAMLFVSGIVGTIGSVLFGFLVIAHAIECVVFLNELKQAPGPLGGQLVQTFLFGVVHMGELRAASGDDAGGAPGGDA